MNALPGRHLSHILRRETRQSLTLQIRHIRVNANRVKASSAQIQSKDDWAELKKERYEDTSTVNPSESTSLVAAKEPFKSGIESIDPSLVPQKLLRWLTVLKQHLYHKEFEKKFAMLKRSGFWPDQRSFYVLLAYINDIATFKRVERVFGIAASPFIRNAFFNIYGRKHGNEKLLRLLQEAKEHGMPQDWAIISAVITLLCNNLQVGRILSESNVDIDTSMEMYLIAIRADEEYIKTGLRLRDVLDGLSLYEHFEDSFVDLINAISNLPKNEKYTTFALKMMRHSHSVGLKIDSRSACAYLVMLIRSATSYGDALERYRSGHEQARHHISHKQYAKILNEYCTLQFANAACSYPPFNGCVAILNDMQETGHALANVHFSILVKYLTKIANSFIEMRDKDEQATLRKGCIDITDRVFAYIMCESTVYLNLVLLAQFMDVHSRLKNFDGVAKLWRMICADGMTHNASVSIVFDACGYNGEYEFAREVKAKFDRDGFVMNRNNWSSWLECLCRLGKIDEAVHELVERAPRDNEGQPDSLSVRVILSFADKAKRRGTIQPQLRQHFPKFFEAHSDLRDKSPPAEQKKRCVAKKKRR